MSDIDLFRLRGGRSLAELIELKRSYIDPEQWRPYAADFDNYKLIYRFAEGAGVPLTVAYNVYTRGPQRTESIDRIGIHRVVDEAPTFNFLGTVSFEDFVAGTYARA